MKLTIKEAELTARALWKEMCEDNRDNVEQYSHIIYNLQKEYGLEQWDVLRNKRGDVIYTVRYSIKKLFEMKDKFEADGIECEWTAEFYADDNWMNQ